MFDERRHDVVARCQRSEQDSVVGLGRPSGKSNISGLRAQQSGDLATRNLHPLLRARTLRIDSRGIAEFSAQDLHHRVDDFRSNRGGRIVIEIDPHDDRFSGSIDSRRMGPGVGAEKGRDRSPRRPGFKRHPRRRPLPGFARAFRAKSGRPVRSRRPPTGPGSPRPACSEWAGDPTRSSTRLEWSATRHP